MELKRPVASTDRPQLMHIVTRYLRGGSERRIRDIVRSVPEADHHLIAGGGSDLELAREQLEPASLTVVRELVRDPSPVKDPIALRRVTGVLRRVPHDLVVTHQSKAGVLGRIAAGGSTSAPVVHSLSMANFGPGYPPWQDAVFRRIEAGLARRTASYAVVGRDLAQRYARIGIEPEKLRVIRSGIELSTCGPRDDAGRLEVRERFGIPRDRPIVLSLTSLEPRKGVLELPAFLAGIGSIQDSGRPYLVIAGEGPLAHALEDAIAATGLSSHAALVGFVKDPGSLIAAADIVVLLSRAEGLPQVLVQAAAAGTPFIAYDVDGVGELIAAGAEGIAVPLGDLGAAARAVERSLARDAGERASSLELGEWAPERIAWEYRQLLGSLLPVGSIPLAPTPASPPVSSPASPSADPVELASGRGA